MAKIYMYAHQTSKIAAFLSLSRTISTSCCCRKNASTVGVIIIGNEILKNQTPDTNSAFLIKHLNSLGLNLCRIAVIRDDVEAIAEETRCQSESFDYVLTAGGVGPTHDDVTYEGVARAVGSELQVHPTLEQMCRDYFGQELEVDAPAMKLARIPMSAKLTFGTDKKTGRKTKFPVVSVQNIYMFPGVPVLLEGAYASFEESLQGSRTEQFKREVFLSLDEVSATPALNKAVDQFHNSVFFGSYPVFDHNYYRVRITLEGAKRDDVDGAVRFLVDSLPKGVVVPFEADRIESADRHVHQLCSTDSRLAETVRIIEQCYEKYGESGMSISFNGGKDCTLLLHLLYACKNRLYPSSKEPIQAFYAQDKMPFPQLEAFIKASIARYGLDLVTLHGEKCSVLRQYLELKPRVVATLLGSRSTDPGAEQLKHFAPTDTGWPNVMRVSPLLDWSYQDVWRCIRQLFVPYCKLYDKGYSSLGTMENSKPNPLLQYVNSRGSIDYLPAYKLTNGNEERAGRS